MSQISLKFTIHKTKKVGKFLRKMVINKKNKKKLFKRDFPMEITVLPEEIRFS